MPLHCRIQFGAVQVVNIASHRQAVSIFLHNVTWGSVSLAAKQTVIAGPTPQAENSFQNPHLVRAAFTVLHRHYATQLQEGQFQHSDGMRYLQLCSFCSNNSYCLRATFFMHATPEMRQTSNTCAVCAD